MSIPAGGIPILGTLYPAGSLPIIDGQGIKIGNVGNPTSAQDVATKAYVDAFFPTPLSAIAQSGASTNQYPAWSGTAWVPVTPINGPLNPGDNGKVFLASNGLANYFAGSSQGQALTWDTTAGWTAGTNFGAQNIVTTGFISTGTNPASAGDLRMKQGGRAYARSAPNTGDIAIFDVGVTGGADTLTFGGNTGVPLNIIGSPVTITASGGTIIGIGTTGYQFFNTNFQTNVPLYRFTGNVCAIQIDPIAVAGATGGLMSFVGQDATGTGTTVGGPVLIRSGTGGTNGTVEMRAGTTSFLDFGISVAARASFGNSSLGTQVVGNSLFFIAGGVQMGLTSASLNIQQPAITFNQLAGNPSILETDDATAGGTGHLFTIHARNQTGTGATVGGKLLLASGSGATNGALELKLGSVSALLFNGTTADFNANQLVTTGSYKVNNTTGFLQVGTDTASASSEAAQTGNVRLFHGATVKGRGAGFTTDIALWDWGSTTSGFLTIGTTTTVNLSLNSIGPMQLNVGSSQYIFYDNGGTPRIDLGAIGLSLLSSGLVQILAQTVNNVNGSDITLQGQNSTGTTTVGGGANIVPGSGTTRGGLGKLKSGSTTPGGGVTQLSWNDTGLGFYTATPVAQASRVGQLTASSGTPSSTISDVGTSFSQSTLNNNFASLSTKMNGLELALHNIGVTA